MADLPYNSPKFLKTGEELWKNDLFLIGAGSAQFGYGTIGDIFQSEVLAGSHIVLHDINPASMGVVESTSRSFIEAHNLPYTVSATTNLADAVAGR